MGPVLPVWVSPLLALIVVAAAAALAFYASIPILREPAGATLPERLHRWRGQHQFATAFAFAPLVLAGAAALWAMPLAWLLLQAVSHRVRRRVFGDTWSLGGQIAWNLRVIVAGMGFWWAVSLAPLALVTAGGPLWPVAAVGAALLVWNHFYCDALLVILGARALADRPELTAAFAPVLGRGSIPPPRLLQAGPRGARVANAFALSGLRGDAVLFFDALLEHATPAESAGVLAHEIGHLEDFATRRRWLYAQGVLLALGATLVTLAVRLAGDTVPKVLVLLWFGIAIGSLIARGIRSQARETASDQRAVELCGGDGEALVRALLRLYSLAHLPRRIDPAQERRATHPSLARRIRAIRAAAGVAPAAIEPRAIAGDGVPRAVLFEAERVVFLTLGESPDLADPIGIVLRAQQVDAIPYGELTELRIEPGREAGAVLVAADRAGARRRLRIPVSEVPAAQALLDLVDQRMTAPPPRPRPEPVLGRVAALLALFVVFVPAPVWGLVAAALVAVVRPATTLLAAIAAGALVTTILPGWHSTPTRLTALVFTALACAAVAARNLRAERASAAPFAWDRFLLVQSLIVGGAALVHGWFIVAIGHEDVVRLHVAARAFASAAATWAALGAFLLLIPRRLARIAAALASTIAAAIMAIGSNAFRDREAPDPLIAAAPPLLVEDLRGTPVQRLALDGTHWSLQLAPDAAHVLLAATPRGGAEPSRVVVAGFDGWRRTIAASEVAFVDAATLLVARTDGTARVLSTEPIRGGGATWTLRVERAPASRIDVDATGRWRLDRPGLDGDVEDEMSAAGVEGRIGTPAIAPTAGPWLVARRRWNGGGNPVAWMVPELSWATTLTSERAREAAAPRVLARSRLSVDCRGASLTSPRATCLAATGDETFVWEIDAEGGALIPVAVIAGALTPTRDDARLLVAWRDDELLALWRGTPRALRLAERDRCPCPHDAAYAAGRLATLTSVRDRTTVALYAITPPGVAPAR